MSTVSYIKNFIKDRRVASITPTSRYTIERVCQRIDFSKSLKIIEYGPADGVFTKKILEKMTPDSVLAAIEINKNFCQQLHAIEDTRLHVFNESVEHVDRVIEELGWNEVDYIISGVPFSFISDDIKTEILKRSAEVLNGDGMFLAYQTSSHLKPFLSKQFKEVDTEYEIRNIPPMCVYTASGRG
ncbi:rRNA adenine N-6-methyltransferase family protein [Balneolaceae bacterium ANBcel3]|nr:rRNA adenine N-6-methyltransferase family protein [Balneolaceae bacterium ANBcel3]